MAGESGLAEGILLDTSCSSYPRNQGSWLLQRRFIAEPDMAQSWPVAVLLGLVAPGGFICWVFSEYSLGAELQGTKSAGGLRAALKPAANISWVCPDKRSSLVISLCA